MSTFDPATGKLRDRDALKSIQVNASGRTKGWVAVDRAADTKTSEILDDDTGLRVNDVTVTEGSSGTTAATFTITRVGVTTGTSSVDWATANVSAVSGSDYVAVPATTVSFAAGETTKPVTVTVNGDTLLEPAALGSIIL